MAKSTCAVVELTRARAESLPRAKRIEFELFGPSTATSQISISFSKHVRMSSLLAVCLLARFLDEEEEGEKTGGPWHGPHHRVRRHWGLPFMTSALMVEGGGSLKSRFNSRVCVNFMVLVSSVYLK